VEWKSRALNWAAIKTMPGRKSGHPWYYAGSHGLFTWGDTAYESYVNTWKSLNAVLNIWKRIIGKKEQFLAVKKWRALMKMIEKAGSCHSPILRGFCSSKNT